MTMMRASTVFDVSKLSFAHYQQSRKDLVLSHTDCFNFERRSNGFLQGSLLLSSSKARGQRIGLSTFPSNKRVDIRVLSPDLSTVTVDHFLDAWDDEYGGAIINPESLPTSANAFASSLRASLENWKLKGKKGIWLKIFLEQSDLIPIAIQEGFDYHHAESGYVMLTYWIPNEPCMLPASPSHQIGVGGFVMNDKKEVLVVKEKCPCSCSNVWKIPTGYINKSEDIFSGVVREVKEETGVDALFSNMVAFRHAHLLAFEKSDLLFICMLKPLSSEITIDEKEIQAAKWMPLDEFRAQTFYEDDDMSKKIIEVCVAAHEDLYNGFTAHHLSSKIDGKLSHLYYDSNIGLILGFISKIVGELSHL